ncbi:MAG: glycosyltransferase family 2 protein [Phycisphaeraceae bacterium]|nr:glycosyltransferase family 2 protein [Phycisphaeraceae bacterium]
MPSKTPISVAICTCNNEATIEAALTSAKWADEVVVVDSGSADRTLEIIQRFAVQVHREPWRGYSAQKQFAASLCRNDWVLILDSDEEVSADLADAIGDLSPELLAGMDVVSMRRRHFVMGKKVRAWSPDWQSRLIHRARVRWTNHALHEDRLPSTPSRSMRIKHGWLEHKRVGSPGWPDYFSGKRIDARMLEVAEQMFAKGKRCRWWDLLFRPQFAFCKMFWLKAGFIDGTFGLLIAQKAALGVQLKYAALWAVQNGLHRRPSVPDNDPAKQD